MKTAIRD